jgi:hypothetical protein
MWLALMQLIGGPVVSGLIGAYKAHLTAATNDKTIAADLAAKEIASQTAETQAITQYRIAEIGHPWEPDKLLGYCVVAYFAKLLVWDKVLGIGVTDPLGGFAETTANLIVSFYFVKKGFENVARILKR